MHTNLNWNQNSKPRFSNWIRWRKKRVKLFWNEIILQQYFPVVYWNSFLQILLPHMNIIRQKRRQMEEFSPKFEWKYVVVWIDWSDRWKYQRLFIYIFGRLNKIWQFENYLLSGSAKSNRIAWIFFGISEQKSPFFPFASTIEKQMKLDIHNVTAKRHGNATMEIKEIQLTLER